MKKLSWMFVMCIVGLNSLLVGCNSDPGTAKDVPMTKEEIKENEDVGKVPGL